MLPEQLDKLNRRSFFLGGGPTSGKMGAPTGGIMGGGLLVSNGPSLGDFLDPPLSETVSIARLMVIPMAHNCDSAGHTGMLG